MAKGRPGRIWIGTSGWNYPHWRGTFYPRGLPPAAFAYLRLHGSTELYASRYDDREIDTWAGRVRRLRDEGGDVHVYFDNDARAHAPSDALRLEAALEGPAVHSVKQ